MIGLLLYGGPGFIRSLTTILAVEGVALAGGLWSAPAAGPGLVDRLRRRWLFCLMAFLAATAFGTAWTFVDWIGEGRLGQGIGLAILAGVPLYAAGTVLGGMLAIVNSDPEGPLRSPGVPAVAGAALGFIATGLLLPRAPTPAPLLVSCLVMLSLGGMIFGSVLQARLHIEIRARRASRGGEVRVEDRRLPIANVAARQLFEGWYLRREISLDGNGVAPWDVVLIRALMPAPEAGWRVLLVGGGASTAPRSLLREHPGGAVDVIERSGAVVELGREHFDTELTIANGERLRVDVGNLEDLVETLTSPYDLVVVDTAALAPLGGVSGLSRVTRKRLLDVTGPAGLIAWGPLAPESGRPELSEGWAHVEFRRGVSGISAEHVVVSSKGGAEGRPTRLEGFESVEGPEVVDGGGPQLALGAVPEP